VTMKLAFLVSSLSTQYQGTRAKAGWPEIGIICLRGSHVYPRTVVSVS
jgi:hypothetical protein